MEHSHEDYGNLGIRACFFLCTPPLSYILYYFAMDLLSRKIIIITWNKYDYQHFSKGNEALKGYWNYFWDNLNLFHRVSLVCLTGH